MWLIPLFSFFSVDHRQLRPVVRAVQDADGDVGHLRGAAPHVGRPAHHQARLPRHPPEQEDHLRQPGPARHPGAQDLQGQFGSGIMGGARRPKKCLKRETFVEKYPILFCVSYHREIYDHLSFHNFATSV